MEFVAKIISILCRTESEIRCLRELSCTSHFTPFPSCNTAYLYRFGIHKKEVFSAAYNLRHSLTDLLTQSCGVFPPVIELPA